MTRTASTHPVIRRLSSAILLAAAVTGLSGGPVSAADTTSTDHGLPVAVSNFGPTGTVNILKNCINFDVTSTTILSNLRTVRSVTNPDGSTTELTVGALIVQFSANGKTLTYNASGPVSASVSADGTTVTVVGDGPQLLTLGTNSRKAFFTDPNSGIAFSTGHLVYTVDLTLPRPTIVSASTTGRLVDVCAQLAP